MKTNIFSELIKTISLLFENIIFEASEMSAKIAFIKERPEGESNLALYIRSLKRISFFVILFPIPILLFGIVKQLEIFVSIAGLLWTIPTILLLVLASPLGFLISAITGRVQETGRRYVQFVLGVLLVELGFTLFVAIVPIENNLAMFPVALVCASILGVLASMGIKTRFSKGWLGFVAANVLTFFVLSCFFPQAALKARGKVTDIEEWIIGVLEGKSNPPPDKLPEPTPNSDTVIHVNAKEKKFTVVVDNKTKIITYSTHPFNVLFENNDGSLGKTPIPAGKGVIDYSCWRNATVEGSWYVEIEGIHDSTKIAMDVRHNQTRK